MSSSITLITLLAAMGLAAAATYYPSANKYQQNSYNTPQAYAEPAETVKSIIRNDHMGNYVYGFETSDGIVQRQAGEANGSKRGYYSYIGPDGRTYTVCYVADELGYRLVGNPMLGAIKEIQCPYETDKRRPFPFPARSDKVKVATPVRRNGYGYDKPLTSYQPYQQRSVAVPVPQIDPLIPPYY